MLEAAVGKLSSEILLFLIAYTILLIGIAVFGSSLESTVRELLYIIPVLGVIAYVWLRSHQIKQDTHDALVRVSAGLAGGGAEVIGVSGVDTSTRSIDVKAGVAHGKGTRVIGVAGPEQNADLQHVAAELTARNRILLLQRAQELLDSQSN